MYYKSLPSPQCGSAGYLLCPRLWAAGNGEVLPRPGEGGHPHRVQGVPGTALGHMLMLNISAVERSIGFTIGFHNYGEDPY